MSDSVPLFHLYDVRPYSMSTLLRFSAMLEANKTLLLWASLFTLLTCLHTHLLYLCIRVSFGSCCYIQITKSFLDVPMLFKWLNPVIAVFRFSMNQHGYMVKNITWHDVAFLCTAFHLLMWMEMTGMDIIILYKCMTWHVKWRIGIHAVELVADFHTNKIKGHSNTKAWSDRTKVTQSTNNSETR